MPKPNYEDCQECDSWDDINGCWRNQKDVLRCPKLAEILEERENNMGEDESEARGK
jgi:hypothetical protein